MEIKLFNLLKKLDEPALIYCSSPDRVFNLANKFLTFLKTSIKNKQTSTKESVSDLIQWIKVNIHKDWELIEALIYSIGVHNGALPRHLASSIVDLFNQGDIQYLFCTSTLIEGVNTSAKSVILFDKKKGPKYIDYFDFKNIIGRSGRMKKHYIGNVFKFHPEPMQITVDVDIPVYTQKKAPIELLVQLDKKDLNENSKKILSKFNSIPEDLQKILKSNVGINIEGQINVIKTLTEQFSELYPYISWSGIPNFEQLNTVINLAWLNFIKKGEGGVQSPRQLTFLALEYFHNKSLHVIINKQFYSEFWQKREPDETIRLRKVIQSVLQTSKHWFDYKLPKLITVMSSLQSYVCEIKKVPPGNYLYFSSQFEHDFLPSNLSVLLEYDVPVSAIRKIESLFSEEFQKIDEIIEIIKRTNLAEFDLLPYELKKLQSIS